MSCDIVVVGNHLPTLWEHSSQHCLGTVVLVYCIPLLIMLINYWLFQVGGMIF